MHLLLKWNPENESDTLDRHRKVAAAEGHTWWSCDTVSGTRNAASHRIERLNSQIRQGHRVFAFVYRTGDDPSVASVWRASVEAVTDQLEDSGQVSMPDGFEAFLWIKLSNFTQVERGWVTDNLDRFDKRQPITAGALRNQTSPLYVSIRNGKSVTNT